MVSGADLSGSEKDIKLTKVSSYPIRPTSFQIRYAKYSKSPPVPFAVRVQTDQYHKLVTIVVTAARSSIPTGSRA